MSHKGVLIDHRIESAPICEICGSSPPSTSPIGRVHWRAIAALVIACALMAAHRAHAFGVPPPYSIEVQRVALVKGGGFAGNMDNSLKDCWIVLGQPIAGRTRSQDLFAPNTITADLSVVACNFPPPLSTDSFWITNGTGFYSDPGPTPGINWSPSTVPNNTPGQQFNVFVNPAAAVVRLNLSPTINQLALMAGARVQVDSTVNQVIGFQGTGVNAVNAGRIRVESAGIPVIFTLNDMNVEQQPTGIMEAIGAAQAATLRLVDSRVTGGTLSTSGLGVIALRNSTVVDADLTGSGLVVENDQRGFMQGGIDNSGDVVVQGTLATPARLEPRVTGAALSGATGRIVLTSQDGSRLGSPIATLTNEAGHTIRGQGQIAGPILSRGLIKADAPGAELQVAYSIMGTGTLTADGGMLHVLASGQPVTIAGTSMNMDNNGQVVLDGASIASINGPVTIGDGGVYKGGIGSSALMTAASVEVSPDVMNGGDFLLTDLMRAATTGVVHVRSCFASLRGCIRPVLRVVGGSRLTVGGDLIIENADVDWTSTEPVLLAGNFDNRFDAGMDPASAWNSANGRLTLNGTSTQTVECAGCDFGPESMMGVMNNFSLGYLTIQSHQTPRTVQFTATGFDNRPDFQCPTGPGLNPACEALYVGELTLGANVTVQVLPCARLYFNTLVNQGATIQVSAGGAFLSTRRGDVDDNGMVNLFDVPFFVSVLLGTDTTPLRVLRSDINGDARPDGADVGPYVDLLIP